MGDRTGAGGAAPPLLRATGVSKRFGAVRALDEVTLEVHRGAVVSLAGENGSGKSTLARILAGVLAPDAGRIELDGTPVRLAGPRQALDSGICLVSQEPALVPDLSVAENVLLPRLASAAGLVRREALARAAVPHLERVGLRVDPRRPARSLGGGDRELLELARALAARPRLLILDEVTARIPDPDRFFQVVAGLAADGVGVVLITHRLREIHRIADRVVVLRDGRNVAELAVAGLSDERISTAMVGRSLSEYFRKEPVQPGPVVLEVDQVVTTRSRHPLSVTVRAGEVVGLAGLVGSGRSELLETVAGARSPVSGRIRVDGRELPTGSPARARAHGVALVPEDRLAQALVGSASISANLALPWQRPLRLARRRRDHTRAVDAVASYGIRCTGVDAPVASLSGGNAQKVAVAAAVATNPRVLLLDEPTRGVDIAARADIYAILGRLVTAGVGILLASSDLLEVLGLCDRIVVLHDGAVVGELPRERASEEAIALLAHGGGVHDAA